MISDRLRFALLAVLSAVAASAAPPVGLAAALEHLRDQPSYSWEVINADPGPVASRHETLRGRVTTVQQNLSPHIKGSIDRRGDMLIRREWSDGLTLETVITADGTMVTKTPEGWMTNQEILTAQAEERINGTPSARFLWLRRADRPDIRRPDQELVPLLTTPAKIEATADTYVVRGRIRPEGVAMAEDPDSPRPLEVAMTINVRSGVIRDYEVKIEGTRVVSRARVHVPLNDQRIVILSYLPIGQIDIPAEALEKIDLARSPTAGRSTAR